MSEYLATIIFQWLELKDPKKYVWLESVPKRGKGKFQIKDSFYLVRFKYDPSNRKKKVIF